MMQNVQSIYFVRQMRAIPHPEAFQYLATGRCLALQRACFWLLRRLRAGFYIEKQEDIHPIKWQPQALVDAILRGKEDVQYVFAYRPRQLIIGCKTYAELVREPLFSDMQNIISGDAQYFAQDSYTDKAQLFDLRVTVVPWIKGWIVLP